MTKFIVSTWSTALMGISKDYTEDIGSLGSFVYLRDRLQFIESEQAIHA